MIFEAILPCIPLFAFGFGLVYILKEIIGFELSKGDFYLIATILSLSSLLIPMVLVGILIRGQLGVLTYIYIFISLILGSFSVIHFVIKHRDDFKEVEVQLPQNWTPEHLLQILVAIFLLEYLFLLFLYPIWGFDAIDQYLPAAQAFVQTNSIPKVNPLNGAPTFRQPGLPLMYAYVLYVTGQNSYQFIPFLALISLVILAYKFGELLFESSRAGWLSALFVLAMPLTRSLMTRWAYYQDIHEAFFFSAAIYFFFLAIRQQQGLYSVMSGLGVILAFLTKLSGITLLLILILLIPSGKVGSKVKTLLLISVALFLAVKAMISIYIGFALVIILISSIIFLIIRFNSEERISRKIVAMPFLIGFAVGIGWLVRIFIELPDSFEFLSAIYLQLEGSPNWSFPGASDGVQVIRENIHRLSFPGTCLILLTSSWFVAGWILLKLLGSWKLRKEPILLIWCLVFLMIWFAYYGLVSVRYLSVLILPIALLSVAGIIEIHDRFLRGKLSMTTLEVIALTMATFQMDHRFFLIQILDLPDESRSYYTHPLEVGILFTGMFILALAIGLCLSIELTPHYSDRILRLFEKGWTPLTLIFLGLLLIDSALAPIEKQVLDFNHVNWDQDKFVETFVYEYRPAFQELVEAILEQNSPKASILGADVPGLEFFVEQPVFDLIWDENPFFDALIDNENITESWSVLQENGIGFITVLNGGHAHYDTFQKEILSLVPFLRNIDGFLYTTQVFTNPEFTLYRAL
ncbi:MAG: hypothetical protein ACE5OZ_12115 [Candidatus Heimdallarchaeota archaeon]